MKTDTYIDINEILGLVEQQDTTQKEDEAVDTVTEITDNITDAVKEASTEILEDITKTNINPSITIESNSIFNQLIDEGVLPAIDVEEGFDLNNEDNIKIVLKEQLKHIKKTAFDEHTKNLPKDLIDAIEVARNGGDYKSIIKIHNDNINPLDKIDLADKNHVNAVNTWFLQKTAPQLDDETIKSIVDTWKDDELKAENNLKFLKNSEIDNLTKYKESIEKEKIDKIQKDKELHKNVRRRLSEQFNLSDTITKKLADTAYTTNSDGYDIDLKYQQALEDPELATHIIMLLNDKDLYFRNLAKPFKDEANKKAFVGIKIANSQKRGTPLEKENSRDSAMDFLNRI